MISIAGCSLFVEYVYQLIRIKSIGHFMSYLDNTIVDSKEYLNYKDNSLLMCVSRFPEIKWDSAKYIVYRNYNCTRTFFIKWAFFKTCY